MTATTTTSYAHAVRAALDDLPAATVAELVDGLEEHLAEVGDDNTTLAELLGPPDRYAAELRATAGLPPRPARTVGARATPWPAPTGPIARVRSITVSSRHVARGGLALLAAVALWWLALVTEGPTVVAAALGAIALWVLLRLVRRAELSVRATHGRRSPRTQQRCSALPQVRS